MDQVAWLESHVANFQFWGGAPHRVVLDNLKDGVLKADLYDPKFNHGYEELARHYNILYFYAGGGAYTAPYQYAGKEVMVRLTPHLMQAYFDYALKKTHVRVGKWQRSMDWNDFPPEKSAFFRRVPDWDRQRASLIGTSTRETVGVLLEEHAFHNLR